MSTLSATLLVALAMTVVAVVVLIRRQWSSARRLDLQRAHLLELFESSSEAAAIIDRGGRIIGANDAFHELFGYRPVDVRGRYLDDLLAAPEERQAAGAITQALVRGEAVSTEGVRLSEAGKKLDVSILGTPVRGTGDEAAAFVLFRDITRRIRTEAAFRRLEKAVDTMQVGVTVTDLEGRIVYTNPADATLHGYEPGELIGRHVHVFANDLDGWPVERRELGEMGPWSRESVNLRKDGTSFPVRLTSNVVRDSSGAPIGLVTTCEDITEQKRAERTLRESEERYALAMEGANDGLWDWNLETDEVFYSRGWLQILGYSDENIGQYPESWLSRVHPEDLVRLEADLTAHRNGVIPRLENEHRILAADGSYRWVLIRGVAERDPLGDPYRLVGSVTDVTERKASEEALTRDAMHDSLTGLPNRAFLTDVLERAFRQKKRRPEYVFAVLFLDLDRFKQVNDTLGHAAGDTLLIEASRRFQDSIRPGDIVARLAGDEFCVLVEDLRDSGDTTRVASRIQESLKSPVDLGEREIYASASIGIAVAGPEVSSPEQLLRNADVAMYRAKARGKGRFEVFDRRMHERAMELLKMEEDLRLALEEGQLRLEYQPVVDLESHRVTGFEALLRWEHPEKGSVPPESFLPQAEETGQIVPVGWWVLREACRQMGEWSRSFADLSELSMSVNLSGKQLMQPDLVGRVEEALELGRLDAGRVCLEVREDALMEDPDWNARAVAKLRELGVRVQIDDFGTGTSSLDYLNRFHVSTVKLDPSYVQQMVQGEHDRSEIVEALITLARALGIGVVAEGVETDEQSLRLQGFRCDRGQGFFYSRPLEAEQATALLRVEIERGPPPGDGGQMN